MKSPEVTGTVSQSTMTPELWKRVEEVFYAALECEASERQHYLAVACGEDQSLRREVESLLAAGGEDAEVSGRVDRLVAQGARLATGGPPETTPPERIGPYRVLREIGRGGLGTVYLADRDDEHYSMRVAIKLVRRGLDTDDILARLRQERQILARLEHPNITRLLDGGSTPEGQPYLVMEYVEGTNLDVFCDHHRLDLRGRLRLALDICAAVGFAHQNLVIHRDIKPSNVLVTEDRTVKLLDFGIAKLLDRDAIVEPTAPGLRLLTPEYASPEQLRGEPLGTASDIYSLGVMLYRLLTGYPPFTGDLRRDLDRVDRNPSVVMRPSDQFIDGHRQQTLVVQPEDMAHRRGTHVARLRQQLRGDLDNVVLKALAEDVGERYGSAAELADDIRRYLEHRPVRAQPASLALRWGKFIRRNRLAVIAAGLVATSLLVGIVSTLWQARIARNAQGVAEHQQDRAEVTTDLLVDLFETSNPNVAKGEELTVRQVLEEGALQIGRLEGQPELRALLMHTVGRVYRNLGSYHQAFDLHHNALGVRRTLLGDHHPQVAESLVAMAEAQVALGEFEAAELALREALDMRRSLFGDDHPSVAEALNDLGVTLRYQRRWDEAKAALDQAVDIRIHRLGNDHADTARSLNNLAVLHWKIGQIEEAEPLLRQALDIRRRVLGEDHSETLGAFYSLAVLQRMQGDLQGSEATLRKTLTLRRKSLGDDHVDVAASLNSLARTLVLQGSIEEALPLYAESVATYERALGSDNRKAAVVLNNLADAQVKAGDTDAAMQTYGRALEIHRRVGETYPETARSLEGLGAIHLGADRLVASEEALRQALAIRLQVHGTSSGQRWRVAAVEGTLGRCLLAQGKVADAEPLLTASLEGLRRHLGEDHAKTQAVAQALESYRHGTPGLTKTRP